jgi:dTMP kinase
VFITFEGIDRSGKTTQARMLAEALGDEALLVREPGGTPAAEHIRDLVKGDTDLTPMAETLLFGAARADLVERVVRPALDQGRTVIGDRYIDSTVAYQGGARGLGIAQVEDLNRWLTGDLWPDVTFLLAKAYEQLAERHPGRYVRIDAARSPEEVHADVLARLQVRA